MKVWYGEYGVHKIRIENRISDATLYIDDIIADVDSSLVSCKLFGELPSGERVIATIGQGLTGMKCKVVVGNRTVPLVRKYEL